jgi:hypothetical protein
MTVYESSAFLMVIFILERIEMAWLTAFESFC